MWWLCSQTGKILNDEDDTIVLLEEANVRLHAHPNAVCTLTGQRIERDPRFPLAPESESA